MSVERIVAGVLSAVLCITVVAVDATGAQEGGGESPDLPDGMDESQLPSGSLEGPEAPPVPEVVSAKPIASEGVEPSEPAEFPKAASSEVTLGDRGDHRAAGDLPVEVAAGSDRAAGKRIGVEILDRSAAERAGVSGFVFRITGADRKALAADRLKVSVDYSAIAQAYGAGYADRLRLVALPGCAVAANASPRCDRVGQRLSAENDRDDARLLADIANVAAVDEGVLNGRMPGGLTARDAAAAGFRAPQADSAADASGALLLAVTAGPEGEEDGTFRASPLEASSDWNVAVGSGEFSWDYPIPAPAPPVGAAPSVGVSYSSGSVDGFTSTSNTQAGPMGLGFGDFSTAFVERRYITCSDDGHNRAVLDLCWQSDNATISLNGRAGELIPVDKSVPPTQAKQWRLASDQRWKVEQIFGSAGEPANGDEDKEWWKVTTPEGVEFWFGRGYNPDNTAQATNSVFTVPMLGNQSGEPCNGTICEQGWRWNLDRVVDPNGNVTTYLYTKETNKYLAAAGFGGERLYTRAGQVAAIEYGAHTNPTVPAQARIELGVQWRCVSLDAACVEPQTGADANQYPDVPVDLLCVANTAGCTITSPSFFTARRYSHARTSVLVDGAWKPVDEIALAHTYKANPAGDRKMYLSSVQRKGLSASPSITLPATTFDYVELENRVTTSANKQPHFRVSRVVDEYGRRISVTYGQPNPCPNADPPANGWDNNPYDCFLKQWVPDGNPAPPAVWSVFRKWLVTKVTVEDTTTGSPAMTTTYQYEGAPAWHFNTDRFIHTANQSWTDWRGYGTALTTHDSERTRHRVLRGMHGDRLANGSTRTVQVASLDDPNLKHTDWNWLAGAPFDEAELSSGGSPTTLVGTVHTYKVATIIDDDTNSGNDPHAEKAAVWTGEETATERRRKPDGSYARRRTTTGYNGLLLFPETVEESGWLDQTGDERCKRTSYVLNASKWMFDYPSVRRLTAGTCATSGAELRRFETAYDGGAYGAAPTRGNVTKSRTKLTATTWAESTIAFDALGRSTSVSDPLGHVATTSYSPALGNAKQEKVTELAHLADAAKRHVTTTDVHVPRGGPSKVTNPNGKVTTYGYDALGRSTWVRLPTEQPAGEPRSYEFVYSIDPGKAKPPVIRSRQLQAAGASPVYLESWTVYDSLLRERQKQRLSPAEGKVLVTNTDYNHHGQSENVSGEQAVSGTAGTLVTPTEPWENRTQTLYDELGRLRWELSWADPAGSAPETYQWSTVIDHTYNSATVVRDRGGNVTTVIDAYDRAIRLEEQSSRGSEVGKAVTRYSYDPADRLTQVTDPASNITTFGYDMAGRRTTSTDPDSGKWDYAYDAAGNQTMVKDPRSSDNVTYINYDDLNRRTERRAGHPTTGRLLAAWAYDAPNEKGLLDSSTSFHRRPSGEGDEAFITDITGYDARSREAGRAYTVFADRAGLFGTYTVGYGYDRADHRISVVYPEIKDPNGQQVLPSEWLVTDYNNLGQPTKLTGYHSDPLVADTYLHGAAYDDRGRPRWFGYGNPTGGVWKIWGYDQAQRLSSMSMFAAINTSAQTQLQARTIEYDQSQNVTRRTTTLGSQSWVDCYGYDDRNRLDRAYSTPQADPCATSVAGTGDVPYDESYQYSIDGNMTQRVENVTRSDTRTFDYGYDATQPHATDLVDATPENGRDVAYTWDAAGQLSRRERSGGDYDTFVWTPDRFLDRIQDPNGNTRDSMAYGPDGQRVVRENTDRTTIFIEGHEISASGGGGITATRTYSVGGSAIAIRTRDTSSATPTLSYLVTDNQESVELTVKDADSTPSVTRRYVPYGQYSGGEPRTDQGWIGQVEDDRTKLNYLNNRYYDPYLSRFVSPDPLVDPAAPQTLNRYSYATNNPTTNSDPSGLICHGGGFLDSVRSCGDAAGEAIDLAGDAAGAGWDATGGEVVAEANDCLFNGGDCTIDDDIQSVIGAVASGFDWVWDRTGGKIVTFVSDHVIPLIKDVAGRVIDVGFFIANAPTTGLTALINTFTGGDCDWEQHLTVVCYGGWVSDIGLSDTWTTGNTINTTRCKSDDMSCAPEDRFDEDLLRHETWHTRQWAVVPGFPVLYTANNLASDALTGDQRLNLFEWQAGFRDGGYDTECDEGPLPCS